MAKGGLYERNAAGPVRMVLVCVLSCLLRTVEAADVTDAWARATVPGQTVGAAYLKITSPVRARLVGVKSPIAKKVEIHSAKMEDGVMRMREMTGLDLPAGEIVELVPMGTHLMLMQLKSPLKEGTEIPLALIIEENKKRRTVQIKAIVKALTE